MSVDISQVYMCVRGQMHKRKYMRVDLGEHEPPCMKIGAFANVVSRL